jgi:hypothetical protein
MRGWRRYDCDSATARQRDSATARQGKPVEIDLHLLPATTSTVSPDAVNVSGPMSQCAWSPKPAQAYPAIPCFSVVHVVVRKSRERGSRCRARRTTARPKKSDPLPQKNHLRHTTN